MKLGVSLLIIVLAYSSQVFADAPPDPGGDPSGGSPVGGGSPIGGGLVFLLSLGILYGSRKLLSIRKKILN